MAGRKFPKFNGYKIPIPRIEGNFNIPKVYTVNGYYIIGEDVANTLKRMGMNIKEYNGKN